MTGEKRGRNERKRTIGSIGQDEGVCLYKSSPVVFLGPGGRLETRAVGASWWLVLGLEAHADAFCWHKQKWPALCAQTAMTYQTLHGFPLPWMAIGMVGVR